MSARKKVLWSLAGLAVIASVTLAAERAAHDDDYAQGPVLGRTYDFNGPQLEPGLSVYESEAEKGSESVSRSMVGQEDGNLVLRTRGRDGSGVCLCKEGHKPTEPYGRWVVRAKASTGDPDHGFAILLWPNAEDWPEGGEIDMLELPDADRSRLQTSVHYGKRNKQLTHFADGDFGDWHEYGVTWSPDSIDFDVDGRTVYVVDVDRAIPTRPMHLAMQAGRNPKVKDPSDQESTLLVDWVKTYPYLGE